MSKEPNPTINNLPIVDHSTGHVESGESLPVYMKAIQKLPLLSRADEIKLAETIRDSKAAIIRACCENPDFYTELFLIKDLPLTEQKKLFFVHLDENSGREQVLKIATELEKLLVGSLNKELRALHDNLLTFLCTLNFTLQDLERISKPVLETGTKAQARSLKEHLRTFKTAKDRMVTANLRLVFSRAKIYSNRGLSLEDLLQEGNLGLIKAIEKYDVSKGWKFGTYATWWIDQALGRAVADKGRLIRIPVHMVENINKISKIDKLLMQQLGRAPTVEELSEATSLSVDKVQLVKDTVIFPHSTEEPQGEMGVALAEYLADESLEDPLENLEREETSEKIRFLLSRLEPREEKIVRMRFGIGEKSPAFLDVIGKSCSLSGERVRQLFDRSLNTLVEYGKTKEEEVERDWNDFKRRYRKGPFRSSKR